MGDDHSDRLGPEGSEQAKVYKGAGNGGEIDHKKLGDNLLLITILNNIGKINNKGRCQ